MMASIRVRMNGSSRIERARANTAEWIVENPVLEGIDPVYLPQFADVIFTDCTGLASEDEQAVTFDINNAFEVTMLDPNGAPMADASPLGSNALDISWVNSE